MPERHNSRTISTKWQCNNSNVHWIHLGTYNHAFYAADWPVQGTKCTNAGYTDWCHIKELYKYRAIFILNRYIDIIKQIRKHYSERGKFCPSVEDSRAKNLSAWGSWSRRLHGEGGPPPISNCRLTSIRVVVLASGVVALTLVSLFTSLQMCNLVNKVPCQCSGCTDPERWWAGRRVFFLGAKLPF